VVYKDLKPENVVISKEGIAELVDFGLSSRRDDLFRRKPVTTQISSPESLTRNLYDEKSDWWSFGCLLYELAMGRKPFDGDSFHETKGKILRQEPQFAGNVDRELRDLIRSLLKKDRASRLSQPAKIRSHRFFSGFDFDGLLRLGLSHQEEKGGVRAPAKPKLEGEEDTYYFDHRLREEAVAPPKPKRV